MNKPSRPPKFSDWAEQHLSPNFLIELIPNHYYCPKCEGTGYYYSYDDKYICNTCDGHGQLLLTKFIKDYIARCQKFRKRMTKYRWWNKNYQSAMNKLTTDEIEAVSMEIRRAVI